MAELELDAGNTFVKWRIRRNGLYEPMQRWKTKALHTSMVDLAQQWQGVMSVRYVSVAGTEVNALLDSAFNSLGLPYHQAKVVAELDGLKNAYQNPQQMGADRWVAMLSAWKQYQTSFCVIDAGSAITIDWVDTNGQHLGGYILPGVVMLKHSLLGQTAEVRWQQDVSMAKVSPGVSTAECVEHGCSFQIWALLKQIEADCHRQKINNILLTGGDAEWLRPWIDSARVQSTLVMDGLQYLDF